VVDVWPDRRAGRRRANRQSRADSKVANLKEDKTAIAPDNWFYDGVTLSVTPFTERSLNHVLQVTGGRIVTAMADPSDAQSGATGYDLSLIQLQPLPAISALPTPNNDATGQFDYLDQRMRTFMRQYSVSGAGIAIAIGGRLAYARAYGYADTELNGGTLATPNTIFRVGSISKFITMAAIMRMIDEGTLTRAGKPLTLDTLIFPDVIRPYLNFPLTDEISRTPPKSLELMTLRNLLQHASGWNENSFPNPCGGNPLVQTTCIAGALGQSVTPTCADIVAHWLIKEPLTNPPGQIGIYSNAGFCLAQTVVDALQPSGLAGYVGSRFVNAIPLVDSVHGAVQLTPASDVYQPAPLAAHDYVFPWDNVVPSKLLPANPPTVDPPYGGIPLVPGLGAGGWKASPVGLLKLAVSINQSTTTGQRLSAGSFGSIFDSKATMPAATGGYFGLGTEMNLSPGSGDVYKTGAEPGGGGMVVYKNLTTSYTNNSCAKCVTWVALVNTEGVTQGEPDTTNGVNFSMIDALNDSTVYNAITSAAVDMFPAFGLPAAP
jgi:CubicO group peptidase (beta-lactamase class C family)